MISTWLQVSGSAHHRRLEQPVRSINTLLPVRRRIMVASIGRQDGTAAITSGLAVMLTRLRPDRLPVITIDDPERLQLARLTSPHAVHYLTPEHWNDPLLFWGEVIGNAQCNRGLTITDWGAAPFPQLSPITTDSHVLCLVMVVGREMIQSTLDIATTLGKHPPMLLTMVDVCGVIDPSTHVLVRGPPPTSVLQRHDRRPGTRKKLKGPDAFEVYRLAAGLVEALTRPAEGRIP